MRKAEASYEIMMLRNLSQAASRSWRATAWALERRFPEMYGRRDLNLVTFDQMELVLNELAQMIIDGISNPADRKRLIAHCGEFSNLQRREAEALRDPLLAERSRRQRASGCARNQPRSCSGHARNAQKSGRCLGVRCNIT